MTQVPEQPSPTPGDRSQYRLAIRRPVTTAMIFLTLAVFGWNSYQQLPINLMPDISYPTLTVRTEYEDAAPEDVEELVTRPLEETLSIVTGMSEIRSISSPGMSEIVLEFTWGTDMNAAQQNVRDQLDLFDPPAEMTQNPVILRFDPTLDPIMRIAITPPPEEEGTAFASREGGGELTGIREAAERYIKSDLEAELGIAQVQITGGQEEEVSILADSSRLKDLGMAPDDVANSLAQQNINLSGGRLREGRTEYLVRTLNEFQTIDEIRSALLVNPSEHTIPLRDVAAVQLGEKDQDTIVRVNGREAVELEIFKEGDANTVEVANTLKDLFGFDRPMGFGEQMNRALRQARLTQEGLDDEAIRQRELAQTLRGHLPEGAELTIISDQSQFITDSIREVQHTAIIGGALALIVLFCFLRELRPTLIVGVAIPISIIATFVPMFMGDISLNIMSLGGLALGIGMLVDNSIIVLESIFRCKEEGDEIRDAAERGVSEVGSAVTASTLTTVAVFFPIVFVEGIAGQIFRDQALTVTFSLLASLLVALFLIPMIASRQRLAVQTRRNVIWPLRAYRQARTEQGLTRLQALIQVGPAGARYARDWFTEVVRSTFGPARDAIRGRDTAPGLRRWFRAAGGVLALPVLALLFVCQVLLTTLLTVLLTAGFVVCGGLLVVIWAIAKTLHLLLWVPLQLFQYGFDSLRAAYTVTLRHSLRFSPVILGALVLISIHAGDTALSLGRELIPPLKQGEFGIRLEAPPGTRLEETERRARPIERLAMAIPEVDTVAMKVGEERDDAGSGDRRGENVAEFVIRLSDPEQNAQHQDAIIEDLRREARRVSPDDIAFTLPTLFSFRTPVELQIRGDDPMVLRELGQETMTAIRGVQGLRDLELSIREGYPEIIIEFDRHLLAEKGLQPQAIAEKLRTEIRGDVPTRFDMAGNKVDMRVRTHRAQLNSVADLRMADITSDNPPLPLSAVADISVREGPSEIRRVDQRRVALVTGNIEGRDLGSVTADIMERVQNVNRPPDYSFFMGGQEQELETSYQSLQFALLLAIFLVFVVMACQFESVGQPTFVMCAVPLAFIGIIYALYWMDISLSVVVFIGGIIVAGIVVNDAIVLIDYINRLRARGLSKVEAVVQGGGVRLRPILMTTMTTILGLVPMAVWTGAGAEMRRPMAITVMAGLLSATVLTLFIIPMAYYLFAARDSK
ncbi:MAG: efflux RND transporter permease subunit [Candidatus Hydrogenedentota bacterium]